MQLKNVASNANSKIERPMFISLNLLEVINYKKVRDQSFSFPSLLSIRWIAVSFLFVAMCF